MKIRRAGAHDLDSDGHVHVRAYGDHGQGDASPPELCDQIHDSHASRGRVGAASSFLPATFQRLGESIRVEWLL